MSLVVELSHFVSFSCFLPGPNKVSEKNIQSNNGISVQESTHQTNGSSSRKSLFHPNHSRWTPAHLGEEYQHPHRFTFQIIRFHYMWFDILLCDWTHIYIPKCGFYSCMVCWWPLEMKRDCFPTSFFCCFSILNHGTWQRYFVLSNVCFYQIATNLFLSNKIVISFYCCWAATL